MKEAKKYVGLLPRQPSKQFINTFQAHTFNDGLRGVGNPNKGRSEDHCIPVKESK